MSQALWLFTVVTLVVWVWIRPWDATLSAYDLLLVPILAVQICIAALESTLPAKLSQRGLNED